jgi:hypothetical protein
MQISQISDIAINTVFKRFKRLYTFWSMLPSKNGEVPRPQYDWDTEGQKKTMSE